MLQAWNLEGAGEHTELLLSELVSNVVRHVGGPMAVRLSRRDGIIRIEVDDASAAALVVDHPGPDGEGRGMLLIVALAARWGTEMHPGHGKTVWFEIEGASCAYERALIEGAARTGRHIARSGAFTASARAADMSRRWAVRWASRSKC